MRQRTTNATELNKQSQGVIVWELLATDQTDPWQIVPRQVLTPYSRLLILTAFAVVSRVGVSMLLVVMYIDAVVHHLW